jgi:hypothetical protein
MGTRMRNYRKRSNRNRNNRKRSKRSKRSERGKRRTGRDRIEVSLKGGAPHAGPPRRDRQGLATHRTGLFTADGRALIPDGMLHGLPAYRTYDAAPGLEPELVPEPAPLGAGEGVLPPGWEKHVSRETGRVYYYNPDMKLTQWGFPDDLTAPPGAGEGLPPGWDARVSKGSGHVYYRNLGMKLTQWEFPVAESEQSASQLHELEPELAPGVMLGLEEDLLTPAEAAMRKREAEAELIRRLSAGLLAPSEAALVENFLADTRATLAAGTPAGDIGSLERGRRGAEWDLATVDELLAEFDDEQEEVAAPAVASAIRTTAPRTAGADTRDRRAAEWDIPFGAAMPVLADEEVSPPVGSAWKPPGAI